MIHVIVVAAALLDVSTRTTKNSSIELAWHPYYSIKFALHFATLVVILSPVLHPLFCNTKISRAYIPLTRPDLSSQKPKFTPGPKVLSYHEQSPFCRWFVLIASSASSTVGPRHSNWVKELVSIKSN